MIVREVFNDWDTEERGTAHHRAPRHRRPAGQAADRGDRSRKKYEVAARSLTGSIQTWFAFPHFFQYKEPVNTRPRRSRRPAAWRRSARRSATTSSPTTRRWSSPSPSAPTAPTRAIQIGSDWYASTDYETHQTSLTKAQAVTDPDGEDAVRDLRARTPGRSRTGSRPPATAPAR